ncbi:unnamed protein product, partial [Closterium sp. NIES-65]
DFHPGDQAIIASCGMDSSIRVWSLQECWHVVDQSFTWTDLPSTPLTYLSTFSPSLSLFHSFPSPECWHVVDQSFTWTDLPSTPLTYLSTFSPSLSLFHSFPSPECWHVVDQSFTWTDLPSKFPTKILQYP